MPPAWQLRPSGSNLHPAIACNDHGPGAPMPKGGEGGICLCEAWRFPAEKDDKGLPTKGKACLASRSSTKVQPHSIKDCKAQSTSQRNQRPDLK